MGNVVLILRSETTQSNNKQANPKTNFIYKNDANVFPLKVDQKLLFIHQTPPFSFLEHFTETIFSSKNRKHLMLIHNLLLSSFV